MPRKPSSIKTEELTEVYNAIEEHIFKTHMLCSIDEITRSTKFSRRKCERILNILRQDNKISIAYQGKGKPTLYIPTYMFEKILRTQHKPKWLGHYAFAEKKEKLRRLQSIEDELNKYEIIERLLYATDVPLEESVYYCLKYLGFQDVKHHYKEDYADISFKHKGILYLLEIEGTTKQGSKSKVNQLHGWIKKAVDEGVDPDRVIGILVVNHFRDKDPKDRGDPITKHAKNYLKLYRFRFFTTCFLFNLMKKVIEGSLTKEKAREEIVRGEKYE